MPLLLGCIADDLTGATDLGVTLAREGFGVIQINGVPKLSRRLPAVDAVVVALKSRTAAAEVAVAQSIAALEWLRTHGAERIYFKYCSTFDSTPAGNIGPVTDALLDELDADFAPATPAYPRNKRTVFQGHLFVGPMLVSESGMRQHPLTPMADSNLVRVLARQARGQVGLVDYATVDEGEVAVRRRLTELRGDGARHAILDAIRDEHLIALGAVCRDMPLATGGAGLAMGIARVLRDRANGWVADMSSPGKSGGKAVLLAGSCSEATRAQVLAASNTMLSFRIDPLRLAADPAALPMLIEATVEAIRREPVLVYATAAPDEVATAQARLGKAHAAEVVEEAFRSIARALADAGVRAFVVAGGETSGAVMEALEIQALAIGPEIDPGVPWTVALDGDPYWLALKSGNFGTPDFFAKALALLP
jgi:uncharacterized protein YgbK (DUF1537 family)